MNKTLLTIALLAAFLQPAFAQETLEHLDKKAVEEFIVKTTAVSSGSMSSMDQTQVLDYLRLHISDDAEFKSKMSYDMPGQEEQENELILTKDDFIKGLESGTQQLKSFSTDIKIKKVKISKDKKSAEAVTETRDAITMPVQEGDVLQDVPLEGVSTCRQKLSLSDLGIIQMTGANCITKIMFQSF